MKYPVFILFLGILLGCHQAITSGRQSQQPSNRTRQITWPATFDGIPLHPVAMTEMEKSFQRDFPGHIATFRCGDKQVILRQITQASRKLHPSTDCLRASGHQLGPVHIHTDNQNRQWAGCTAKKSGQNFLLLERITDQDGRSWTDTSSWYWHALLHPQQGPWLAQTVIQRHPHP